MRLFTTPSTVWMMMTIINAILVVSPTLTHGQATSRNLTIPSTAASSSATATPSGHTTTNTTAGNGTIAGGNSTVNGTNGTVSSTSARPSTTSISISTTLAETKGVTGTDVPNPFATGSTGGNSQNPDDSYIAGAARTAVVATPWCLAASVGMLSMWILL